MKKRTILITLLFILLIGGSYLAYNHLSSSYNTNNIDEKEKIEMLDFTVYDETGKEYKLSDFKGKPIVLNFWASWCPPCISEMPHFNETYLKYKDKIHFLMINSTDGSRETLETAQAYLKDKNYSFTVLYDTKQYASYTYQVSSLPTTYFIDKDGYLVVHAKGAIDQETLNTGINYIYK